jgi:3-phenylpropionate/cinnamic acid dioxygenase small subunit
VHISANFICHRYRRYERLGEYVGKMLYTLRVKGDGFLIKERRVLLKSHELGSLGSVSFIL